MSNQNNPIDIYIYIYISYIHVCGIHLGVAIFAGINLYSTNPPTKRPSNALTIYSYIYSNASGGSIDGGDSPGGRFDISLGLGGHSGAG